MKGKYRKISRNKLHYINIRNKGRKVERMCNKRKKKVGRKVKKMYKANKH